MARRPGRDRMWLELARAFASGFAMALAALAVMAALQGGPLPGWVFRAGSLPAATMPPANPPSLSDAVPERVVFQMKDPSGDDNGPGGYVYPTHDTFVPGLLDLTAFAVGTGGGHVYFDLTFRAVNNPWDAPEGFYHQLIDIYIDTTPGEGRTEPLRPGPRVRFDPAHAWDVRVRAAPFGGTRLHWAGDAPDAPGLARGLAAQVLKDGRTIRVAVPAAAIGTPQPSWRYYVLVGGFDAFGDDGYRAVGPEPAEWRFGGRDPAAAGPQVIDILAPRWWRSQARQLRSFAVPGDDPASRGSMAYALLHPVGPGQQPWLWAAGALAAAGLAGSRRLYGRRWQRRS